MTYNLFIVESPLQALIASEISCDFDKSFNILVVRVFEEEKETSNIQISNVIELGNWSSIERVAFDNKSVLKYHFHTIRLLRDFEKRYENRVDKLYMGEFRARWMHFIRSSVKPVTTFLMDDGTSTVEIKNKYLDKGKYYPKEIWSHRNIVTECFLNLLYYKYYKILNLNKEIFMASAFYKEDASHIVDFSNITQKIFARPLLNAQRNVVLFFGGKYSEAGVLSLSAELESIEAVINHYKFYGKKIVYFFHRGDSQAKKDLIRSNFDVVVKSENTPAEIHLLKNFHPEMEVASFYSTVLNNARILFPDICITAFSLPWIEVYESHRDDIKNLYEYYSSVNINIVDATDT